MVARGYTEVCDKSAFEEREYQGEWRQTRRGEKKKKKKRGEKNI